MRAVLTIAAAEWRCWQRSRMAMGAAALLAVLLLAITVLTALRLQAEAAERAHHQGQAEAALIDAYRAAIDGRPLPADAALAGFLVGLYVDDFDRAAWERAGRPDWLR
jgi:hypothetical protein